jgi:hypothetical protein
MAAGGSAYPDQEYITTDEWMKQTVVPNIVFYPDSDAASD